jgi:hypothetical protein
MLATERFAVAKKEYADTTQRHSHLALFLKTGSENKIFLRNTQPNHSPWPFHFKIIHITRNKSETCSTLFIL